MMDDRFYRFWSEVVVKAASGGIRPDAFADWLRMGGDGSEILKNLFQKYYGQADTVGYESAMVNFKKFLADFYEVLDVVPKQDYLALENQYQALKRKTDDLEALVTQLKVLYKTCRPDVEKRVRPLNQMLKSQNEQFLKMMDSLAEFYGITPGAEKKP